MSIKTSDKRNNSLNSAANTNDVAQEGTASAMPPAQLFSSTLNEKPKEEEEETKQLKQAKDSKEGPMTESAKTTPGGNNNLPPEILANMENALGHDFSNVNIHQNSKSAEEAGALAYAQGNNVHFAPGQFDPGSKKGQELIGHEMTHVAQQREGKVAATTTLGTGMKVNDNPGLEKEADEIGAKAAKGEEVTNKKSNTKVAGAPVAQGYFDYKHPKKKGDWRQSDDMSLAVKVGYPNHELYASKGKVAASNAKLKAVKSGVELVEKSTTEDFKNGPLNKVEVKNNTNATEGDNMELYADCGKSNAVVVGGSDRQAIYNNPDGLEAKASGSPETMKSKIMRELLIDRYHNSSEATEKKSIEDIFRKTKGYENEQKKLVEAYNKAKTEGEKKKIASKYRAYNSYIAEAYWSFYNNLSDAEKLKIDKKAGINKFANPDVGQGFTTSSGGDPVKGFERNTWNFHWGGVVMNSNDNKDKIILENYAVGVPEEENKDWEFAMYGTDKEGQSFHETHKDTNQHGESPTTMAIEKK